MKLHTWVIRNDEKGYVYLQRAKSLWTLRRNVNERKETIVGRRDKLKHPAYIVDPELGKGSFRYRETIGTNGELYKYY